MPSFFFNDTATTEIYTLSLHDALPISLLELVEQPDELPAVVAKRVRDRALRLVGVLVERDEDRVVVWAQAALLVGTHRVLLRREPEPLQEERRRADELLREAGQRPGRFGIRD